MTDAELDLRIAKTQYDEAAWWSERKSRTTELDATEQARLVILRNTEKRLASASAEVE